MDMNLILASIGVFLVVILLHHPAGCKEILGAIGKCKDNDKRGY